MAKKAHYHFDRSSLTFKKVKVSFKQKFWKFMSFITSSMVFSVAILALLYSFFDSPKERILKREIEQYKLQYDLLNKRVGDLTNVQKEIEKRDENIYRMIFEAEPIPASVRAAGYGGSNKYADLEGYGNSELIISTTKKVDQLSRQLYVQSLSFDEVVKMVKNKSTMLNSIPAIIPVSLKRGRIVSGFGRRMHPILKRMRPHTGIDITARRGTPVYATGDGRIMNASVESGYGRVVNINHGYGYVTKYAHLMRAAVSPGQKVKRGDIIGYVGSTGLSVSPHLHYEVIKGGEKINPVNFFYMDITMEEYQQVLEESSKVNQALS